MSNIDTAIAVLAKASLFDPTFSTPDKAIAVAWAEVLGDTNRDDALQAVSDHYTTKRERLMPSDVLAGVKRIRADRIRRFGNSEPDYDGDDVKAGLEAIRRHRQAIADGGVEPSEQPPSVEGQKRVVRAIEGRCELPADVRRAFSDAEQLAKRKRADRLARVEAAKAERRERVGAAEAELAGSRHDR